MCSYIKIVGAVVTIAFVGGYTQAEEMRGIVRKVNSARHELTVEGRGRGVRGMMFVFTASPDTKILFGKQLAELGDISPGARVVIDYDSRNGVRTARTITVRGILKKPDTVPTDPNTIFGTIARISTADRAIVVRGGTPTSETSLAVPENASITRDKKAIKLDDVREGEAVRVRTAERDGKLAVASMDVGVTAQMSPEQAARIERLRQILKITDSLLQRWSNGAKPER